MGQEELSEHNNIISPDDLRYNQNDPVTYTQNNWQKVTTLPGQDTDHDEDVTTISSSTTVASMENYEEYKKSEDVDLGSDVSLEPEYNREPETLLTAIQDTDLDERNMTEISSVLPSSTESDYHGNDLLTINDGDDQDYYDSVPQEGENDGDDEAGSEAGAEWSGVTTQQTDIDQTNDNSQFPIREEVIPARTDDEGATPSAEYDVTTTGAEHRDWQYEEPDQETVIDGDDYSEYSVAYDDNNERDETSLPHNSSLLQFANIFSLDDSQVYQNNETSTNPPPSAGPLPVSHDYDDDAETGPDDSTETYHPPLLTLMHNEPKRLRFLIQPQRFHPDTKVREFGMEILPWVLAIISPNTAKNDAVVRDTSCLSITPATNSRGPVSCGQ